MEIDTGTQGVSVSKWHAKVDDEDDVREKIWKSVKKDRDRDGFATHREIGRSGFPITRVQKILKADKELPAIAKEAVFAISIATEEFIRTLCSASQKQAERERRSTVQRKDLLTVSKRAAEFWFLEDFLLLEQQGGKKDITDNITPVLKANSSYMGDIERYTKRE